MATVVLNMLTIKGIYGREMFETWYAMSVLVQSGLDISGVITHRFPYTEHDKAFATTAVGNSGKVIMIWDEICERRGDLMYGTMQEHLTADLAAAERPRACTSTRRC